MELSALKENAKKNTQVFGKTFNRSKEELRFPMMVKLQEEVGELADAMITKEGLVRKEKAKIISNEKLGDEIADILFTAACVGECYGVDIEKALEKKMALLKERWDY